jgi:hypothetical protein
VSNPSTIHVQFDVVVDSRVREFMGLRAEARNRARGFGHQLLIRDAFGQELLTCSTYAQVIRFFDRTPDLLGFFQAISNLTRIPEACSFCPQVEHIGQELLMSTDVEKIRSKYHRVRDCVMKAHRRGPASRG